MLLLLSCFSHVRLCAIPYTAAHQAPPSLGFSRQEHWSGLPFPSPMRESEVTQSCPTLRDPMDCSLPGSSVHGIFQARVLERGAITFSDTHTHTHTHTHILETYVQHQYASIFWGNGHLPFTLDRNWHVDKVYLQAVFGSLCKLTREI